MRERVTIRHGAEQASGRRCTAGPQLELPAVRRLPACIACGSPVERRRDAAKVFVGDVRRGWLHVACVATWAARCALDGGSDV